MRDYSIAGAISRLKNITVVDLHKMGAREIKSILTSMPIVITQVEGEKQRRIISNEKLA